MNMNRFSTLQGTSWVFALLFFLGMSQVCEAQYVERKVNQTFNTEGIDTVQLNVEGEITEKHTPGSHILLETTIRLSYANIQILDMLIQTGRYHLDAKIEARKLIINAPRSNPPIQINKVDEAQEFFSYRIFLPEDIPRGEH